MANNSSVSGTVQDNLHNDVRRLLDMIDPKKQMHNRLQYDFYSGYILMVAKLPDVGSFNGYVNQQATQSVQLFGQLPPDVLQILQTTQRRFQEVCFHWC